MVNIFFKSVIVFFIISVLLSYSFDKEANLIENIIKSIEFTIPKDFTKELFEIYDKYIIIIEKHNEVISKSQENKIEAQKKLRLNEVYIFSDRIKIKL